MRWFEQLIDKDRSGTGCADDGAAGADGQLALFAAGATARTFDTPEFRGTTFYEVQAKSVLNRVPGAMPYFRWTINPYRGCGHRCVYCFARKSHSYLDLGTGQDFDTKIVVKVNAPEVLRAELARPSWRRDHVAMGTNVDCYQRAEGRYRLMPEILAALAGADTPFSILTKGTLILRDLDLLLRAADRVRVSVSMSVGFLDERLWRSVEAGTPSPRRRLETVRALSVSGLGCSVLMAPILPWLTDSPGQLRATVQAVARAGAESVTPLVLHLRPGAREWYSAWLAANHPDLVGRYRALYGSGSYAPRWYQRQITDIVRRCARECGLAVSRGEEPRRIQPDQAADSAADSVAPPQAEQPARPTESAEPAASESPSAGRGGRGEQMTLI
jgi:DNA repair photolyase